MLLAASLPLITPLALLFSFFRITFAIFALPAPPVFFRVCIDLCASDLVSSFPAVSLPLLSPFLRASVIVGAWLVPPICLSTSAACLPSRARPACPRLSLGILGRMVAVGPSFSVFSASFLWAL